eukprot:30838-Pelagococcus_subviridis.AAC.16
MQIARGFLPHRPTGGHWYRRSSLKNYFSGERRQSTNLSDAATPARTRGRAAASASPRVASRRVASRRHDPPHRAPPEGVHLPQVPGREGARAVREEAEDSPVPGGRQGDPERAQAGRGAAAERARARGRGDRGERRERGRRVQEREHARPEGSRDHLERSVEPPDAVRQGGETAHANRAAREPRRAGPPRPRRAVPVERLHGPRDGARAPRRAGRAGGVAHAVRADGVLWAEVRSYTGPHTAALAW